MLRDVVDLRQNKWVPRREENYNPKTIDQIHKEAQMEKVQQQEQRLAAQMPAKDNKQKKGGSGNEMERASLQNTKKAKSKQPLLAWRIAHVLSATIKKA